MSTHARQRTRLDPEVRRGQIVAAATRAFRGRHPADVTFEEIAEAAGVSRALVYNYFGDRGGLLAAVYLETFGTLLDELNATVDADLPPSERMRAIVRGYLEFAVTHREAWRLLQHTATTQHPEVIEARRRHMCELASWWGGAPAARVVAFGVVGLLEAASYEWVDSQDTPLDELAEILFDLVWLGLSQLHTHGIALPDQRARQSVPT